MYAADPGAGVSELAAVPALDMPMCRNGADAVRRMRVFRLNSRNLAWPQSCSLRQRQRRLLVNLQRAFRAVSLVVLMAALLLLYSVHPIAGWTTVAALGVGTIVARLRKMTAVVAE